MHKMHVAVCRSLWLVFILTSHTLRMRRMHLTCFFHLPLAILPFSSAFSDFRYGARIARFLSFFVLCSATVFRPRSMSSVSLVRVNSEFYYIFEYFSCFKYATNVIVVVFSYASDIVSSWSLLLHTIPCPLLNSLSALIVLVSLSLSVCLCECVHISCQGPFYWIFTCSSWN